MSTFAASGYSRETDSQSALREAFEQASGQLTGQAHTAWIMASHHHAPDFELLQNRLDVENVFGGTAYGAITEHGESEEEPGLGLLLLSHPELKFQSHTYLRAEEAAEEAAWGRAIGEDLQDSSVVWLFLNEKGWPETVAEGLAQAVPSALIAGGGLPGGWDDPRVLSQGRVHDPLVWGVGLSGAKQVEWTLAQALAPLTEYTKVSGLVGDRVQRLGGKAASLMVAEQLGPERYKQFCAGQLGLYARIPGGEQGRADRLFRVGGVDEKNEDLFVPGLPEDAETLALAIHCGQAAREEFKAQVSQLRVRIEKPLFGVYLNCCGRGQDLYGELGVDAALFAEAFPNVPLIGLSVGFELAPRPNGARLCSYTGILVLVGA